MFCWFGCIEEIWICIDLLFILFCLKGNFVNSFKEINCKNKIDGKWSNRYFCIGCLICVFV